MSLRLIYFLSCIITISLSFSTVFFSVVVNLSIFLLFWLYFSKITTQNSRILITKQGSIIINILFSIIVIFLISAAFSPNLPSRKFDFLEGIKNPTFNIIFSILSFSKAIVLAFIISQVLAKGEYLNRLLKLHILSGALITLIGIISYILFYLGYNKYEFALYTAWDAPRLKALSEEPQSFAGYLMTIIPLLMVSLISKEQIFFKVRTTVVLLFVCLIGLLLTFSTGGFITFLLVSVVVFFLYLPFNSRLFSKKKLYILVKGFMFLSIFFLFSSYKYLELAFSKIFTMGIGSSESMRYLFWKNAFYMGWDNLLLGLGPERYGYFFEKYNGSSSTEAYIQPPQNIILGFFANTGIISVILLLFLFFIIYMFLVASRVYNDRQKLMSLSLSLILLSLFVQHQAFWMPYSYTLWFFMGLFMANINATSLQTRAKFNENCN